jgi:hypothetical protein
VRFDASTAECLVYTYREGLLAAVGHDLCLRVTRFVIDVGDAATGGPLIAEFDAGSLQTTGGINRLDARKIERNAARDVLDARRFPTIAFRSSRVERSGERARIDGALTLHGVTQELAFDAVGGAADWRAEVRLDQRDFGIAPYRAMLGALRVRADVLVSVRLDFSAQTTR